MSNFVPFLNVKSSYKQIQKEIDDSIFQVLDSGNYILGEKVSEFEEHWASYCEAHHAIGVGNGLDALKLALLAVNIRPGDEVIVPAHTFIATWLAVSALGARPIPVDINKESSNIDESKIELAICKKTKAIIPVHMYGNPCNLKRIHEIALKYNLYVIEDAAQAHGSIYLSKKIGALSDLTCWSFYPGKNLGAFGDGGAVTTNNSELADKIRCLRNYGSTSKYIHNLRGINSRLDPIQACILNTKLKYLDAWNSRRNDIANMYIDSLKNSMELKIPENPQNGNVSCWHLYVIQCIQRNKLQDFLSKKMIETLIHYPIPPFKQKVYAEYNNIKMPNAINLCSKILSLPICPFMSDRQVDYVINALNEYKV